MFITVIFVLKQPFPLILGFFMRGKHKSELVLLRVEQQKMRYKPFDDKQGCVRQV